MYSCFVFDTNGSGLNPCLVRGRTPKPLCAPANKAKKAVPVTTPTENSNYHCGPERENPLSEVRDSANLKEATIREGLATVSPASTIPTITQPPPAKALPTMINEESDEINIEDQPHSRSQIARRLVWSGNS
ncbi:hypothetical protein OROGR_008864 [Orobanche gracilis]